MASVTFNFVQKITSLRSKKSCQDSEGVSSQLNKSENTLMEIQKILIWDDPFFSCCCIISVNIVFWLIIYLDFKFYGIIFASLLILTCEQLWMDHFSKYLRKNEINSQNLESNSSGSSEDRTSSFAYINPFFKNCLITLKEFHEKAKFLRQSQPGMFCLLTCAGFLFLGVIGRSFSGVIAFYILLMLIMTVPGVLIRFLPPDVIKSLTDIFYSSHREGYSDNSDEVETYLPDTSEEALELLRLAGELEVTNKEDDEESNDLLLERISGRTSETTESVCSKLSLYPESVVMPSPENSMDCWEFDLPTEEKCQTHDTEINGINFQSQHFDGDSSEEEFIKGLDLSVEPTKKSKKNESQQSNSTINTENLSSWDKKFLATEPEQKNTAGSDKESSDTDSFELISEEDIIFIGCLDLMLIPTTVILCLLPTHFPQFEIQYLLCYSSTLL